VSVPAEEAEKRVQQRSDAEDGHRQGAARTAHVDPASPTTTASTSRLGRPRSVDEPARATNILPWGIDKRVDKTAFQVDNTHRRACQDLTGPQACPGPGGAVWRSVSRPK
jgi:hypothetical protein